MIHIQQEITNGLLVDKVGSDLDSKRGRDVFQYVYESADHRIWLGNECRTSTLKHALEISDEPKLTIRHRAETMAAVTLPVAIQAKREVSSSKILAKASEQVRAQVSGVRDSVVVQSIEVHDTLREVTTITVDRNDRGDTLRQSIVTDRYRGRDAQPFSKKKLKMAEFFAAV